MSIHVKSFDLKITQTYYIKFQKLYNSISNQWSFFCFQVSVNQDFAFHNKKKYPYIKEFHPLFDLDNLSIQYLFFFRLPHLYLVNWSRSFWRGSIMKRIKKVESCQQCGLRCSSTVHGWKRSIFIIPKEQLIKPA